MHNKYELVELGVVTLLRIVDREFVRNGDDDAEADRGEQVALHGGMVKALQQGRTRDGSARRGNGSSSSRHL